MRFLEMLGQLGQGGVRRPHNQRQDLLGMGLDPMRAVITAPWSWTNIASPAPPIDPLIAVEGATPKRFAAERRVFPPSTAETTRSRMSLERDFVMQAGLLLQPAP